MRKILYIAILIFFLVTVIVLGYVYRRSIYSVRNRIPSIIVDEAIQASAAMMVNAPIILAIYRRQGISLKILLPGLASVFIDLDHILQAGTLDPYLILLEMHRFPTHSLTFAALLGFILFIIFRDIEISWMVSSGLAAHLLFDAASGGEIKILYPFLTIDANDPSQRLPLYALLLVYAFILAISSIIVLRGKLMSKSEHQLEKPVSKEKKTGYRKYISKEGMAAILIPLFVRLLMEISTPYPVGFETTIYAAMIKAGALLEEQVTGLPLGELTIIDLVFRAVFPCAVFNLLKMILDLNPVVMIKLIAIGLAGFMGYASYRFARRYLQLSRTSSLLASIIAILHPMGFRVLWDFHRNAMALGLILLAFSYLREPKFRTFVLSLVLALFASLSHQFVALLAVATYTTYLIYTILKMRKWDRAAALALGLVPMAIVGYIYLIMYFGGYLRLWNSVIHFKSFFYSYPFTDVDVKIAMLLAYLLYLPLFILMGRKGYKNDPILTTWLVFVTIIWFSGIILTEALPYPHRWSYLAVYPLAMYVARRYSMFKPEKQKRMLKIVLAIALVFHFIWFVSGMIILPSVRIVDSPPLVAFGVILPGSTYYSSIPIQFCPDLVELIGKIDYMGFERIGAHRSIFFLLYTYYDGDVELVYNGLGIEIPYEHTLKDAVVWFSPKAHQELFWWYEKPENLEVYVEQGNMAIYSYKG